MSVRWIGEISLVLASLMVIGCINVTGSGVTGTGPVVTEDRQVGAFDTVEVRNGIKLVLSIGASTSVTVAAQQNILPLVSTIVADGKLTAESTGSIVSTAPITVTVVTPALTTLMARNGASIDATGIAADSFTFEADDGAHANISGTTGDLAIDAEDGVLLQLGSFVATNVTVSLANGVTGLIHATGSVSGTASDGVLLSVAGGGTITVSTSGGAFVTSQ